MSNLDPPPQYTATPQPAQPSQQPTNTIQPISNSQSAQPPPPIQTTHPTQTAQSSQPSSPTQTKSGQKDGESLATILDKTQREDLTLLLATIIESMRTSLLNSFDANVAVHSTAAPPPKIEGEKSAATAGQATVEAETLERQRQLRQEIQMNLATPETRALKADALNSFNEWANKVFARVGEVVNSPETVKKQSQEVAEEVKSESPYQVPEPTGTVTDVADKENNLRLKDIYPPVETPLAKLPEEKRNLILHSMLLLMLSLENYNSNSRVLLLRLTSSLLLRRKALEEDENTTAQGLLAAVKELSAGDETKQKVEASKESRKWKIGLASVAGAAVIGITGGLAAPLVAAGLGSVLGGIGLGATAAAGYLGAVAGSTVIVGGIFGAYGGKMTGKMMEKYSQEVEDFQFVPVHNKKKTSEDPEKAAIQASEHDHKLRVTICISGWLTEKPEVVKPWRVLGKSAEVFALKYELEALLNLGNAIRNMVTSKVWTTVKTQIIARTIFATLNAALWPLGLLRAGRVIDNPFNIAKLRSDKAGEILADALINRVQGERPVTLIGYSLGARVIYMCLKSLARRKAFGLVENAIFLGAPTPSDTNDWRIIRTAVSGRVINVYSENDLVLGFMYRTSSIQLGVAGLQKIEGLPGVENINVSQEVDGHLRYRYLTGAILKKVGFEDVDLTAVEAQAVALQKMIEEEKDMSLEANKRRLLNQKSADKPDEAAEAEAEAEWMEENVKKETEKDMMTKFTEFFQFSSDDKGSRPSSRGGDETIKKPAEQEESFSSFISSLMPDLSGLTKTEEVKAAAVNPEGAGAGTTAGQGAADHARAGSSGKTWSQSMPTRPQEPERKKSTEDEGFMSFLPKFGFS